MNKSLENKIESYFESTKRLSKHDFIGVILIDFPNWSNNTINMYLSKLKKEGKINNPSRGIYELGSSKKFNPLINASLKKIFLKINKEYPFINCCIWNTIWLNDLMQHQPFKNYTVIEVDKEASEQVFNFLSNNYKNVFLNPDSDIFNLYISALDEIIIIKNLISEAPIEKIDTIKIPTLEKLLVDMLIDEELFAAQQGEIEFIFKTALSKYVLNKLQMKRYAMRRNREKEIENIINISLAK